VIDHPRASSRFLPLLVLLFVGSGCAALIYEIIWFQLLSLIIGSSAISLTVLLVSFMGGMCIGSLALSRLISPHEHPLRVYAMLEAGIAVCGFIVLAALPHVGGLYTSVGGPGFRGLLFRSLFCLLFLLPPTVLMGATLPAIARWVEATPRGVSWLGFFYGGNTAGAVLGCLLAGFYLLRVHDMSVATFVAVALNLLVAGAGLALAKRTAHGAPGDEEVVRDSTAVRRGGWPVYVAIGLSGLTALGAEVVWTRLLALTLGGTVYTFSLILAVFLLGLGIGSGAGSALARYTSSPRQALGVCQLLVMVGIAWGAYSLAAVIPYWPINPALSVRPRFTFEVDLLRALWAVLLPACAWGASFPLALAAIAPQRRDLGHLVGGVYAANTVGAILGAGLTSLALIPALGTQNAQRLLIGIAGVSALLLLVPDGSTTPSTRRSRVGSAVLVVAVLDAAIFLVRVLPETPALLVMYGRTMVTHLGNYGDVLFVGEGVHSSVAISRGDNGVLNYHNAGKIQASSSSRDMRLERMLGHLTTLLPARAESVLVIGCGAGVTAGAVAINPMVRDVTIAEIEPLVPRVASTYFGAYNHHVVDNPKVTLRIDDGRHFLLTTDRKFDAITSDPFDTWVKGSATLYTREFFEEAKRHLKPGGVVTVWAELYESGEPAVKSAIATFLEVFPNGVIFGNPDRGRGYDLVLLGTVEPLRIDVEAVNERLARPDFAPVAQSLREIGFHSAVDLFSTYAGSASTLAPWLADAEINRDRNLRLQYLAGLGINRNEQAAIYSRMLSYRRPPVDLFEGSEEQLQALWKATAAVSP
jgi:spermidine synthase